MIHPIFLITVFMGMMSILAFTVYHYETLLKDKNDDIERLKGERKRYYEKL